MLWIISFVPLLQNADAEWRESFLYEYFQESYAPGFVTATGVRSKKYKYIDELYDLEKDPGEMINLIESPDHQLVRSEMKRELEKLKTETGYFDPGVYKEKK
jgi:hypothetical protein